MLCRALILDRCSGTFQPRMSNYWMFLNSSDSLQHLSLADNHFVSDEDLHVLSELEKLLSLNFSGCAQVEDEGLAVGILVKPLCIEQGVRCAACQTSLATSRSREIIICC